MPRVFLITGTSTGFGKHLVQEVIEKGDIAVATARDPSTLSFENTKPENYLAVKLDVTVPKDIDSAFSTALERFGRVDVVINNAGYSLSGPFEELSDAQIKKQMDVNFFGLLAVTRKAMEVMCEQRPCGGLIQQVTSIGGQLGYVHPISLPFLPISIITPYTSPHAPSPPNQATEETLLPHSNTPQPPHILHLLRLQMGHRRLHRSHLPRSKTHLEHPLHPHRARRLPHRHSRSQHGIRHPPPPRLRAHRRQEEQQSISRHPTR